MRLEQAGFSANVQASKAKAEDDDEANNRARRIRTSAAAWCARWLARGRDDGRRRDDLRLGLTGAFPLGCADGDLGLYRRAEPLRSSGRSHWADRARHRRAHDE